MHARIWKSLFAASFALALAAYAEDKEGEKPRVVRLPMTGVMAGCCDSAVEKEMKPLDAVAKIAWEGKGKTKWAIVTLKKDATLELSKVQAALEKATSGMGKAMGTEYKLDAAALPVDASVVFRTGTISNEGKAALDKAFAALKGFESCEVDASKEGAAALTLKFKEKESASLEQVTKILKEAKIDVKDVVFRGTP